MSTPAPESSLTVNNNPTTSTSTHTHVPDEITDHEDWTEGDFEVITADKVRFRVPSYHLFSAR